jgi:hypothetical protein
MRFFSNDAKETHDDDNDRPDDAPSVPQQRIGSPWSDTRTDNSPDARTDDAEVTDPADEHVDPELLDGEPAEAKTTETDTVEGEGDHNAHDLGGPASSADTAETHDDLDLPLDEKPAETEPFVSESTVTSPDAPVDEPTDAEVTGSDEDPAIRDEGDFDEPHAVDPATDETLDTPAAETEIDAPVAVTPAVTSADEDSDSTTYASAAAASPTDAATDTDVVPDAVPAGDTADDTAVVAAVPVAVAADDTDTTDTAATETAAAKPGTVEEKSLDTLFGADAAKAFQERWRDVQLRFVDSPKDAAAEAAGLVDEAVDQLTSSLKAQKDGLVSDSDDTEKLRIELRGYRDILNRVLSL